MIEVIKPGLETSIQDYPGRIGYWAQGFPPSGAFWKLGQAKPAEILHFKSVTVDEAQALRRKIDAACSDAGII